ncbi:MAG: putative conserved rane protein [Rhizobium sp.]|nr:putative conserved rane protein [Rhizobium sp.]
MTDFDADEAVAPAKKEKTRRFWTSDRIIGYSGAALALTAAFFPWYVFFNGAKFGLDVTASLISRNFPGWSDRPSFSEAPTAITNEGLKLQLGPQDQLLTGTVPGKDEAKGDKDDPAAVEQPFPTQALKFHLLHVSKGKALIEDGNGVYIVGPGSALPDQSKVTTLEQRDGQWVIVTNKGDVYDNTGKRQ